MTNKEKTAWLGRYLHEQARQRMLYGEVEALQAQAARTAEFLGGEAPRTARAAAQLQAAKRRLDAQAARCLALRRQIVWAISRLEDERQREVLLRRFVRADRARGRRGDGRCGAARGTDADGRHPRAAAARRGPRGKNGEGRRKRRRNAVRKVFGVFSAGVRCNCGGGYGILFLPGNTT